MAKAYGVGSGQVTWHNWHFTSQEEAELIYQEQLLKVQENFTRQKLRPVTTEIQSDRLLRGASVQNTTKGGNPGQFKWSIHLYEFSSPACSHACTACDSLRGQV